MFGINLQTIRLVLLAASLQHGIVVSQNTDDVQKCTNYKKIVFEEEKSFSAFFPNAPVIKRTVDHCRTYTPLIVGGRPADPKEFPHIARLGIRDLNDRSVPTKWVCGGALITERYVLTAAHCFGAEERELNVVRLGELDFSTDTEDAKPQDYGIRDYYEHKDYDGSTIYNDIGLIELDEDVKFDRYKHPACLPLVDGNQIDSFIAVGWGATGFAGENSQKLLKVKLDRFDTDTCRQRIESNDELPKGYNEVSQMCVGSDKAKDTCNGDSGGPLLTYHKDYPCMYHVIGVTSAGPGGCGTPNVPGLYTRVHHYLDWIRSQINK